MSERPPGRTMWAVVFLVVAWFLIMWFLVVTGLLEA